MKIIYLSNAEWPKDTVYAFNGDDVTTDKHDTEEQAQAVCRMLEREGFGGEGKIFPIKTWVGKRTVL